MPILQQRDQDAVRRRLDNELKRDVNVTLLTRSNTGLFIPGRECPTCHATQELLGVLTALSPKIKLDVIDYYGSPEDAQSRGVEKIPAVIIGADGSENARFYGLPAGFEFAVLVDSVVTASTGRSPLLLETRRQLKRLKDDVHIQVFVTPNCQYCPNVARLAHAMALESPNVVADVVQVQEFPHLARMYKVMGVPKTVINDTIQFTGAVDEDEFMERVLKAVGAAEQEGDSDEELLAQTTPI